MNNNINNKPHSKPVAGNDPNTSEAHYYKFYYFQVTHNKMRTTILFVQKTMVQ